MVRFVIYATIVLIFSFYFINFCLQNESELFGRTLHVNLAKPMWHSKNISRPAWAFEDWLGNFSGSAGGGPTATTEGGAESAGGGEGTAASGSGGGADTQQTFKPNVTLAEVLVLYSCVCTALPFLSLFRTESGSYQCFRFVLLYRTRTRRAAPNDRRLQLTRASTSIYASGTSTPGESQLSCALTWSQKLLVCSLSCTLQQNKSWSKKFTALCIFYKRKFQAALHTREGFRIPRLQISSHHSTICAIILLTFIWVLSSRYCNIIVHVRVFLRITDGAGRRYHAWWRNRR